MAKQLEDEFDTVVAIGQGATTETTMRIGHLGFVTEADIDAALDVIEKVIRAARRPGPVSPWGTSLVDPIAQDGMDCAGAARSG